MERQNFLERNRMIVLHLLFWAVYFSFFFYGIVSRPRPADSDTDLTEIFFQALVHTFFLAVVAYANYFIFLPNFIKSRNGWSYSFQFILLTCTSLFFYIHLRRYLVDGYTHKNEFYYSTRFIASSFVTFNLVSAFIAMFRFISEWRNSEEQKTILLNEKLTSELKFLKNQINPHFLFNTLNNLYSLAYSHSPKTTEIISRLSQMMRYMVYDSNHERVPLEKEIEYIQNYITLEKLRLNDEVPIHFQIKGDPKNKMIAPLLLIPFLENAFKHGVSNNNPNSWVNAVLNCETNDIHLEVTNSKSMRPGTAASTTQGIGLDNVKKRLNLNYHDRHKIKLEDKEDQYSANLELQLN